jgi:nucleoside-diphosphate-sugar epimerase
LKNILITGCGGFIGGYLANYFAKNNDFNTYATYRSKKNNDLEKLLGKNHIWTNFDDLSRLPEKIDILLHSAAEVPSAIKDEEKFNISNNLGSKKIFNEVIKRGCKRIIYLSSMSVYGQINIEEINEEYKPVNPDKYGISKLQGEKQLINLSEELEDYKILRLPGIIGLGAKNNFLSSIIPKIVKSEDVSYSNLNKNILFNNVFHVSDLANLIEYFLKYKINISLFNICALQKIKLYDLLEYAKYESNSESNINFSLGGKMPFNISTNKLRSLNNLKTDNIYLMIKKYINDLKLNIV